jgi:hypothetical protein
MIDEYQETRHLSSVPHAEGTYKVYLPEGFKMVIREKSDATKFLKQPPYDVELLSAKWKRICKYNEPDNNVVYIGKADDLQKRTRQFLRFSIGLDVNHAGGRALWQLENNKQLLFEYTVEENCREKEKQMIEDFMNRHGGEKPFANIQR